MMKLYGRGRSEIGARHIVIGLFSVVLSLALPSMIFENYDDDLLLVVLLLLAFLLLFGSLILKVLSVAIFNATFLFIIIYPYYIQSKIGFKFSTLGDLNDNLNTITFYSVAIYLLATNYFGLRKYKARKINLSVKKIRYRKISSNVWVVLFAIYLFIYIYMYGWNFIFLSRVEYYFDHSEGVSGAQRFIVGILKIFPFWIINRLIVSRQQRNLSNFNWQIILITAGALLICNPGNTQRYLSLAGIIIALFPVMNKYNLLSWLPALLPLTLFILPLTSAMRFGIFGNISDTVGQLQRSFIESFKTLEFSSMHILNDGFIYSSDVTGWFGKHLLSAVFIIVPRSMWPDKNTGTGIEVAEAAGYVYTNVGVSPIFDAYLDFGVIGVIMLGVLTGLFLSNIENILAQTKSSLTSYSLKIPLYIALLPIFIRGDTGAFILSLYSFMIGYILFVSIDKLMRAVSRVFKD